MAALRVARTTAPRPRVLRPPPKQRPPTRRGASNKDQPNKLTTSDPTHQRPPTISGHPRRSPTPDAATLSAARVRSAGWCSSGWSPSSAFLRRQNGHPQREPAARPHMPMSARSRTSAKTGWRVVSPAHAAIALHCFAGGPGKANVTARPHRTDQPEGSGVARTYWGAGTLDSYPGAAGHPAAACRH